MILLDTHVWHWWVNQIPGRLSIYRELDDLLVDPATGDRVRCQWK